MGSHETRKPNSSGATTMRTIQTSLLSLGLLTLVTLTGCPPNKQELSKDDPLVGGNPVVSKSIVPPPEPVDQGTTPASLTTSGNLPGAVPLRMDGPERTTSAKQTGGPQWKSEQKPATNTKSTSSSQKTNSMNSNVMPKLSKPRPDHGQGIRDVKDSNPRSNSQGQRPQVTTPPKKVQSEARPAKESRHTTQYKSSQPTDPAEIALKSLNVKWEEERVQEGVRVIAYIPDRQFADGNHFQKTTFTAADRASALRAVVQKALEVPKQKY